MNLEHALPPDELLLARLTAVKLGKVMHGLMSVGTACLEMESPADFLAGRERTPLGLIEVLSCIGVKPTDVDKIQILRAEADQLAEMTGRFHRYFMELAPWRTMSASDVQTAVARLGDSYAEFCRRLGGFCALLGMDADFSEQGRQDRSMLEGLFRSLRAGQPA